MTLPLKVRALFGLQRTLTRVGLAPDNAKAVQLPMEQRLAMGPGPGLTGPLAPVPNRDERFSARDGAQLTARVYEPAGASAPVLYLHGGGFALGGLASCDHLCRRLAVEAGVVVVSVEYRLAPEHPYPTPLNDAEDALQWLLQQGWDNARLVLAGDSAGGNLAAALALRLRDRGTAVAGQLLIYPAVDMTASGPGISSWRGPGLTADDCRLCAQLYLAGADPRDPYASPLHHPDLTGLPPALVMVVEVDPLREQGMAYAQRLRGAGVPTTLLDVPGHAHGSLSLPRLYDGVDALHDRLAAFLRDPAAAAVASP